ncbi:PREDICTED: GPI ethanolamine phosphate transferase 3-like isoform X2 [Amphimedon queenslandica]|uniref:GPI ethanolamine phosphate transferase 2 C-terminal domain-containing protein n=1 Tax=Amphimedon queenslandica TaxID=400682 RepID=A0AAN0J853_AMPQE|nr:PREDICTED: GPI ethanolamine phosphate transferase 3-like isoform X2 [Amphimedon queenslandica]|eukprot:XP_019852911.1 PREDICTED: GPI ethanolamine phosphate transferase 3-like isoform X2 [Amphimedon queenslandica]
MRRTVLLHLSLITLLFLFQALGIVLFLKGYLLTRVVIPQDSPVCFNCSPRYFQSVVWILVDALRHDFVLHNSSLGFKDDRPFYINQMRNIQHFLAHKPRHTKLYRFIADPPTTTMQRLKALTTGTLPTFIDIGSNFNSYQIQEDNIIRQSKRNGLKVTFLGDDTWMSMYPDMFYESYPFPSLNVKDLDTVDKGVYANIIPVLKRNDSDFIIGHFLGVDHCGHTYGPNNHIMRDKLIYIDDVIRSIFELVNNNTIVFVFGDHGMTSTGDHGGQTLLETEAALVVYSKRPLFDAKQDYGQTVYQTDLVPTVSLLLGLPIPFSNLGMIIPELFIPVLEHISPYQSKMHLINSLRTNSQQLHAFIKAQNRFSNDIPHHEVLKLQNEYSILEKMYTSISSTNELSDFKTIENQYINYMAKVREICLSVWTKFDTNKMNAGVIVLILHVILLLTILFFMTKLSFSLILAKVKLLDAVSVITVAFHSVSLFSNSFVVYEGKMVTFLMQSFMAALIVTKFREEVLQLILNHRNLKWNVFIIQLYKNVEPCFKIMVCVHISRYSHVCRDQQDDCTVLEFFSKPDAPFSSGNYLIAISIYVLKLIKSVFQPFVFEKHAQKLIVYSLVVALCGIFSEILSVFMYWIYVAGVIILIFSMVKLSVNQYRKNEAKKNFSITLDSYSWILLLIWISVSFIVKGMNNMLLIPLSISLIQFILLTQILSKMHTISSLSRATLCSLLSYQFFFSFGHQATITSLHFDAAFVGVYGEMTPLKLPIAGLFVTINTLASQVLSALVVPLLLPCQTWLKNGKVVLSTMHQMQLICTLLGTVKLLCSVVAAFALRRHLMVWAVFGPRFMYEAAFQFIFIVTTVSSYLLVLLL